MSRITWVGLEGRMLIDPLVVVTSAIFDVTTPSEAFKVEANGHGWPAGHRVINAKPPTGTTLAFKTNACAEGGMLQALAVMFTSSDAAIPGAGPSRRVSNTLQPTTVYTA